MCWNKGRLCWKIANLFYFCHLKKLVRPETFGHYYVITYLSNILKFCRKWDFECSCNRHYIDNGILWKLGSIPGLEIKNTKPKRFSLTTKMWFHWKYVRLLLYGSELCNLQEFEMNKRKQVRDLISVTNCICNTLVHRHTFYTDNISCCSARK